MHSSLPIDTVHYKLYPLHTMYMYIHVRVLSVLQYSLFREKSMFIYNVGTCNNCSDLSSVISVIITGSGVL